MLARMTRTTRRVGTDGERRSLCSVGCTPASRQKGPFSSLPPSALPLIAQLSAPPLTPCSTHLAALKTVCNGEIPPDFSGRRLIFRR